MKSTTIKRALIAAYDKTGIADFAKVLTEELGIEILSTGGTARHLKESGIAVTMVETVTAFPEMLDGRVKTLHPHIHAGILADRSKPDHLDQLKQRGIEPIDMVVVNLYPFEDTTSQPDCTLADAVEMIDIGGPCMLRAAAKNHQHVVVAPSQDMYEVILEELQEAGDVTPATRLALATETFAQTAEYDVNIHTYLAGQLEGQLGGSGEVDQASVWFEEDVDEGHILVDRHSTPRYGENPHQQASVWTMSNASSQETGLLPAVFETNQPRQDPLISGQMSFNNYVDGDAALNLVKDLSRANLPGEHVVAFIKHTNACGCAVGQDPMDTYRRAYLGDPIAAAGGVLCMNFQVTREIAEQVMLTYRTWGKDAGAAFFKLDVWIAPGFDDDAVELITTPTEKRKWGASCRLLAVGPMSASTASGDLDIKKITGGMLVQQRDSVGLNEKQWQVATQQTPSDTQMADLRFAWLVCKHTKSNAITVVKDHTLLGSGAGQMSRVKSCELAIQLARENGHEAELQGAVAAGDAFFPVPDGPQRLIDAGIRAIIQPGGSNRDADAIAVCDEASVAMVITGTRHFKH